MHLPFYAGRVNVSRDDPGTNGLIKRSFAYSELIRVNLIDISTSCAEHRTYIITFAGRVYIHFAIQTRRVISILLISFCN
jgi:hypothetical protein